MPKPRSNSAYTLIEILVGLTIVGLLFGFGFVSFRDFSRRQTLAGSAKKVQGDLRLTQESALSGKKPSDFDCNPPTFYQATVLKFILFQITKLKQIARLALFS